MADGLAGLVWFGLEERKVSLIQMRYQVGTMGQSSQ